MPVPGRRHGRRRICTVLVYYRAVRTDTFRHALPLGTLRHLPLTPTATSLLLYSMTCSVRHGWRLRLGDAAATRHNAQPAFTTYTLPAPNCWRLLAAHNRRAGLYQHTAPRSIASNTHHPRAPSIFVSCSTPPARPSYAASTNLPALFITFGQFICRVITLFSW